MSSFHCAKMTTTKNRNKRLKRQLRPGTNSNNCNAKLDSLAVVCHPDLTRLILSKLPLRDLLRCTAVCKSWKEIAHSIRNESLAGESSWLLLHKTGQRGIADSFTAYSPVRRSWFLLGDFSSCTAQLNCRADLVATSNGLVCCLYRGYRNRAELAVFNPVGSYRRSIPLRGCCLSVEAVALFRNGTSADGFRVLLVGRASLWGSTWEVCTFDSAKDSLQKSSFSVESIIGAGRGFLTLICSAMSDAGSNSSELYCVWGSRSVPQVLVGYQPEQSSWRRIVDYFPVAWQCVGLRGFKVQVRPNLMVLRGRVVTVSIRQDGERVEIWELNLDSLSWIQRGSLPGEMWSEFCREVEKESVGNVEVWIYMRVAGSSSGNLVYVVMDWGWRFRVLVHDFTSGDWNWIINEDNLSLSCCRIGNCLLSYDPNHHPVVK